MSNRCFMILAPAIRIPLVGLLIMSLSAMKFQFPHSLKTLIHKIRVVKLLMKHRMEIRPSPIKGLRKVTRQRMVAPHSLSHKVAIQLSLIRRMAIQLNLSQ